MNSFVNRLFTVKCFETDFHLMSNIDGQSSKHINMPEGIRLAVVPGVCFVAVSILVGWMSRTAKL